MVPWCTYMNIKVKIWNTISDDIGVLHSKPGIYLKQAAALAFEGCKSRENDPDLSGIQPPTYAVELLKAPASTCRGAPQQSNCSFVLTTVKVVQCSWSTQPSLLKNARLLRGVKRWLGGRWCVFCPFSFLFLLHLNSGYLQMIFMTLSWQQPRTSLIRHRSVNVWMLKGHVLIDVYKFIQR